MRLLTSSVPEGATVCESGSLVPQMHLLSSHICRCETLLAMHEAVRKLHATGDQLLLRLLCFLQVTCFCTETFEDFHLLCHFWHSHLWFDVIP